MKLSAENKSGLNLKSFECNECCKLHNKFTIKNINVLFCVSYFTIFLMSFFLMTYMSILEQRSHEIELNVENLFERKISKYGITLNNKDQDEEDDG